MFLYCFLQICKKLAGAGQGTAQWCTNLANERGKLLACVLTCDESYPSLRPMADGVMKRYERNNMDAPEVR